MRTKLAAPLVPLAMAIAMIGGTSQAHAGIHCPEGKICMWEDPNAEGSRYVETSVGGVGWFHDIDWWNGDNEISSVENSTNRSIRVWTNDNPTGRSRCYPPHTYDDNLKDAGFDNDFESFIVVRSC